MRWHAEAVVDDERFLIGELAESSASLLHLSVNWPSLLDETD